MRFWWVFGLCFLLVAACQPTPPPAAVPSTPVDALPVHLGEQNIQPAIPTALPDEIIAAVDADYTLLSNLYDRTIPSVVNIEADIGDLKAAEISRGSGFVYDRQGHLLTSAHVIKGAKRILVTFNDGTVTEADLVGMDTYSDLAVIHVFASEDRLRPLVIAGSGRVRVGQRAIAIGNPFGLSGSMSVGIVSGMGRMLRSAALIDSEALPGFQNPDIIQTDTPINPGNSGGPLLNSHGEVIGVTTAIRTESGIFQGVGFAVPSRTVQRIVPQLIKDGRVQYPWLGLIVMPDDNGYGVSGLAETLKLPVQAGVLVRGVTLGSPADQAGLHGGHDILEVRGQAVCVGGDIIVAVNESTIRSMDDLMSYLIAYTQPGDKVSLRIVRGGQTFDVPVTLQARPTSGDGGVRDCGG